MTKNKGPLGHLKALARDKAIPEAEMDKHVKELAGANDRVAAIVGGTILETNVAGVLRRYLRPLSKEDANALFSGVGPLTTFSNQTRVAYAMGLLSDQQYRNINCIREIRNVFAHGPRPLRFKTPEIENVCKLLVITSPYANTKKWQHPRKRYLAAVLEVGRELANQGQPRPGGTDVYTIRVNEAPKAEHILEGRWPVKVVLPLDDIMSIVRLHPLSRLPNAGVLHAQLTKGDAIELYSGIQKIAGDLGWRLPAPPEE